MFFVILLLQLKQRFAALTVPGFLFCGEIRSYGSDMEKKGRKKLFLQYLEFVL